MSDIVNTADFLFTSWPTAIIVPSAAFIGVQIIFCTPASSLTCQQNKISSSKKKKLIKPHSFAKRKFDLFEFLPDF